ncbi:MAG: shikimate kinase [Lachnospiraceae bacterium]|nr:shikimate kinase [Lachnospiraceae bacterium]
MNSKKNIVLIGMPASGKSTVGVILAKILGMDFIDTDLVIQQREDSLLNEIINDRGVEGFLKCEEDALLTVNSANTVIATGGSAVYSDSGMRHLSENGTIIYLKVDKDKLFSRLHDINERGVVLRDGESPDEMYEERSVLYEKYAETVIDEGDSSIEETVRRIIDRQK